MTPLQNLPKNVGDLGKLVVAKGFKKLPNLVTLYTTYAAILNPDWLKLVTRLVVVNQNASCSRFTASLNWALEIDILNIKK